MADEDVIDGFGHPAYARRKGCYAQLPDNVDYIESNSLLRRYACPHYHAINLLTRSISSVLYFPIGVTTTLALPYTEQHSSNHRNRLALSQVHARFAAFHVHHDAHANSLSCRGSVRRHTLRVREHPETPF